MPTATADAPGVASLSDEDLLNAAGGGAKYETQLNPQEEQQYTTWKAQHAPNDSGFDYDFRGAFKAGVTPNAEGHWPDTFKKPIHATFSQESIYAKDRPELAGAWEGEQYVPPHELQLRGLSDEELAGAAVKQGLLQPDEAAEAVRQKRQTERAPVAEAVAEGVGAGSPMPTAVARALLTKGGRAGDVAAQVLAPIFGAVAGTGLEPGGGTIAGGAAGGAVGDTLAQAREYFRGERDKLGKGELAVNTVLGAVPLGGRLLGSPARIVATRAAQGFGLAAGGETAREAFDEGKLDFKNIMLSGGFGALFGSGAGGLEAINTRRAVLQAIRKTPEFRNFEGSDTDLVQAVRDRMKGPEAAPAEPRNVTPQPEPVPPATPPPESAAPAPGSSGPTPADIPREMPAVPGAPAGADYRYTVQRPTDLGNGKSAPGFVQVDEIINGQRNRSATLEDLRKEGIQLPDVPEHLPTKTYTLAEIRAASRAETPPAATLTNSMTGEVLSKGEHDRTLAAFQKHFDQLEPEAQAALDQEGAGRWLASPEGQRAGALRQEAELQGKQAEQLKATDPARSALVRQSSELAMEAERLSTSFAHKFRAEVLARPAAGPEAPAKDLGKMTDDELRQAAAAAPAATHLMTPEQYAAHEKTLPAHKGDFVPAMETANGQSFMGQAAAVWRALKAGEKVPPEVLARFPAVEASLAPGVKKGENLGHPLGGMNPPAAPAAPAPAPPPEARVIPAPGSGESLVKAPRLIKSGLPLVDISVAPHPEGGWTARVSHNMSQRGVSEPYNGQFPTRAAAIGEALRRSDAWTQAQVQGGGLKPSDEKELARIAQLLKPLRKLAASAPPAGKAGKVVKVAKGQKVVTPTPAVEVAVSKLAEPKQLKVQKEFLVDAARQAAKEAPSGSKANKDKIKLLDEYIADVPRDKSHTAWAAWSNLNRRLPSEKRTAFPTRERWEAGKLEDAQKKITEVEALSYRELGADGFVTIHVPDDGTFRVPNNKGALELFAQNAEKRFGKGLQAPVPTKAIAPKLTADELAEYRVKEGPPKTAAMGGSAPRPSAAAKRVAGAETRARELEQKASGLVTTAANLVKAVATPAPGPWFPGVRSVFAPQTLDAGAKQMSLILRAAFGREYQALEQADHALQDYRKEFDRTPIARTWRYDPEAPLPRNYDVMRRIDTGALEGLTYAELRFAEVMREQFDSAIEAVQAVSPNSLRELLTDYFPRIWKDPGKNASLINALATHRPLEGPKSFLRQRTLDYFTDGLKMGLQPVSDNPVDVTLQKLGEMARFATARRAMAEAKASGLRKFKYIYEQMPDGWRVVDDPSSSIWKPPTVTIQEAYDAQLRAKTIEMLKSLGIPHQRLVSLGGERWGDANEARGIRTKFGGPDFVFWHEAGHMLDWRYPELRGIVSAESTARAPESPGAQMRALADLRWEGENRIRKGWFVSWKEGDARRSKFFRNQDDANEWAKNIGGKVREGQQGDHYVKYVRKTEEKIANMFDAYIRAPEKFRAVAPDIWKAFAGWLQQHPEVRGPLDAIKPSLRLGGAEAEMFVGGPIKLGDWIMPEGAAQVLDNYLQPGLGRYAWFRGLRDLSGLANGVQLLGFFHGQFVENDAFYSGLSLGLYDVLNGRAARGMRELVQIPVSPVTSWLRGRRIQQAIRNPEAADEASRKLGQLAVEANLRAGSGIGDGQLARQWARAFRELRASPNTGAALETFWRTPFAAVEAALSPVMRYLVPPMKLGIFARMAERVQAENPNATAKQLREGLAEAADATEDRLGQVTYNNLFQRRTLKDVMQLALRAYGWQLTKYRMIAGGAADWGAAARDAASGRKPRVTFRMAYLPAMVIGHAIIGATLQFMLTGRPPRTLKDYLFPETGLLDKLGRPVRVSIADFVKDVAADWRSFPNLNKMGAEWTRKLAPFWNMAAEMYQNRDFWGTEIFSAKQPGEPELEHLLKHLGEGAAYLGRSSQPFSVRAGQKFADAGASKAVAYGAPIFGFVPAPRYAIETPMQSFLSEQAGRDQYARTQEQAEQSRQAREISAALREHRPLTAAQQTAMRNLSRSQLANAERRAFMDADVWAVRGLDLDRGMAAWDLASHEERAKIGPTLRLKLGNAFANRTHDAATLQRYLRVLNQP